MPPCVQVGRDGRSDAAGTGDGDLHARFSITGAGAALPAPSGPEPLEGAGGDQQVEDVTVLTDEASDVEAGDAGPGDRHQGDLAGNGELGQSLACPPLGQLALDQGRASLVGSDHSPSTSSGSRRRRTWSIVHDTVATVAMPSLR